jgi:hypothetical protein
MRDGGLSSRLLEAKDSPFELGRNAGGLRFTIRFIHLLVSA